VGAGAALASNAGPVVVGSAAGPTIFNISGNTTIYVQGTLASAPIVTPAAAIEPAVEKKLRFDMNYARRRGYAADFLAGFAIPVPSVEKKRVKELLPGAGGKPLLLKYHHFSLVLNEKRRLQMWSAVNVSYDPAEKTDRPRKEFGTEDWSVDPRVPAHLQLQDDDFYKPATRIDRGHIVRREDNAWGRSDLEIEYSNSDTFHWTNCTPQHEAFNQERQEGLWGQFEAHITANIAAVDRRASLFAGPVLDNANDPKHDYGTGDVQYPLRFWKVVAAVSRDRGAPELVACGFLFDQSGPIERLGLERIDFSKFRRYQVSLKSITKLTGVVFPQVLHDADPLRNAPAVDERLELNALDDVRLRPRR
jgi:endonuclease G